MIEGMTIGALKACIAEAEARGVINDDSLVVMYVPLTDGMITPLAYVDPNDMYVGVANSTTGDLVTWDNDVCYDHPDIQHYHTWREHAKAVHKGVACLVIHGLR